MSRRPSPQPVHKKTVPYCVKKNDGDPITRNDLQYDLLTHIFSDEHPVFTDPNPTLRGDPPGTKTTFHDLYINALIRSPRASKVLKEKMTDTPEFGTDFAKLALLANVGRINTTMAFFPEMKTAIRTYHPIPALQKTNGNLQDAPRIKNILKSCLLDGESKSGFPSTPLDILSRSRSGHIPPTSVVNLIFVMANHAAPLAQMHFENTLDFLDLFLPINVSSASRARAFLWLCYHYLESAADNASRNPFSDPQASHPNKIPPLVTLTQEEMELENVDSPEELAWGEKMMTQRKEFQARMEKGKDKKTGEGEDEPMEGIEESEPKEKVKGKTKAPIKDPVAAKLTAKEKKAAADKARRQRQKEAKKEKESALALEAERGDKQPTDHIPTDAKIDEHDSQPRRSESAPQFQPVSQTARPSRRVRTPSPTRRQRYDPYRSDDPINTNAARKSRVRRPNPPISHRHWKDTSTVPQRTILQQAWEIVTTTDPLVDSDDEYADDHVRIDCLRKLHIVSRIRGKEPTPEPQYQLADMDVDMNMRTIALMPA